MLTDLFKQLPAGSGEIVLSLIGAVFKIIRAGDDAAKKEEALMEAEEAIKAERDREKFGAGG